MGKKYFVYKNGRKIQNKTFKIGFKSYDEARKAVRNYFSQYLTLREQGLSIKSI